jgi:maltokinase
LAPFEQLGSGRVEDLLTEWLPQQRWFAGKGRDLDEISIVSDTELIMGDPALHHVIVTVRQGETTDRYQVIIGSREDLPGRLEYAEIGALDGVHLYDAVHDPDLTRALLANMAAGTDVGELAFRSVPGTKIETDLDSLASPAEQSNTSLIYGDAYICKLFRRITPGINPDLEVGLGLARVGCEHIPALYGWIETPIGVPDAATLAMLSEFLRSGSDGWQLATTSVRDYYNQPAADADDLDLDPAEAGGDFAAESERLGAATAAVHRDLAIAFGTEEMHDLTELVDQMSARLDEACAAVPELAPYAKVVGAAFDRAAKLDEPFLVQRIHGDYHLGQVMRTDGGWMVLDFEGEPVKSLAERRATAHPLRDVAGMLRSFEYAARHLLVGHVNAAEVEQFELRARAWADRNRAAFCRGYAEAGGADPAAQRVLLTAFEFDKAVYEVMYEARNRPSWLHIPLGTLSSAAGD